MRLCKLAWELLLLPRAPKAGSPAVHRRGWGVPHVDGQGTKNGLRKGLRNFSEDFNETHYRNHQAVQAR